MTVLALDGALGAFSAAIADDRGLLAQRREDGKRALESGLAAVATLMQEAGIDRFALTRIAVGTGPGGFTGLRIAISYAKALALAWRIPLVPITSFDLLEGERRRERALAVVAGRPGIIYARFRDGDAETRAGGATAEVLARLPLPAGRIPVFGAPEDALAVLAERGIDVESIAAPACPASVAALIARAREPAPGPHGVRPDYGELPAAKVPRFS